MKLKITLIGLLIIFTLSSCYSQELTGKWALFYATDLLNNPIASDLTFQKLNFISNEKVEVFPKVVVQDMDRHECAYKKVGDSLIIEFSYFKFNYKIESLSGDSLILSSLNRKYYFRKYFDHKDITHQSNGLLLVKDTVLKVSIPMYNRDLYKFFSKNMTYTIKDTSSYNIDVEFILRKTKDIDSIIINADTIIRNELIAKILKTEGKWIPAKSNYKKIDSKIKFKILVASKDIENIRTRNPKTLCYKLFDKGYHFYRNDNIASAYYYFSECVTFYDFYESLSRYGVARSNIHSCWVNAVMNKAVILYKAGLIRDACINWSKIVDFDGEAYNLYKANCLDIE